MSSNSDDRKRPALQSGVNNKKPKTGFVLRKLSGSSRQFTRYNDEVHNSIDLCPVMKVLFDTKQFQRLRSIKQLGTSFFVYANANHTRFEHSVGVAYLAERMCSRIQRYQHSTLETTDKDVLCVTLAGLLHDIGHGPFSHVYEEFRGELAKDIENDSSMSKAYEKFPPVPDKWSHENSSLAMVDAALESLGLAIDMDKDNLDKPLKQIGDGIDARSMRVFKGYTSIRKESAPDDDILTSRDWIFIKECIYGKPIPEVKEKLGIDERIGRLKPKQEWLYDVVANRHNGIDVDKVDYFARDERRSLGEAGNIKIPIIDEARVALATCPNKDCKKCTQGGQHYMICYPKKCVEGVMDFYRNRYKMHTTVYQHKTTTAGACMVVDILKKADLHYLIPAGDQRLPISRAIMNNEAFCRLKDTIIESIAESTSEELRPARELAERFLVRDLYKFAGERVLNLQNPKDKQLWDEVKENSDTIARAISKVAGKHSDESGGEVLLELEDIIVKGCSWDYGKKDKNPLSFVRFINRDDLDGPIDETVVATEVDNSEYVTSIPQKTQKNCIRIFCRDPAKRDLLAHKFEAWEYEPKACINTPSGIEAQEESSTQEEYASDRDSNYGNRFAPGPVQLTQDSGDEDATMSPMRSPGSQRNYESPIPLPNFRAYGR